MRGSAQLLHAEVELVADELMRFKGWPSANRLALMHVTRRRFQVDRSLSPATAGCTVGHHLLDAVDSLPEAEYHFVDREYPRSAVQESLKWELAMDRAGSRLVWRKGNHPARVCRVMIELERYDSYDMWRKLPQLERGLLTILAEQIVRVTT